MASIGRDDGHTVGIDVPHTVDHSINRHTVDHSIGRDVGHTVDRDVGHTVGRDVRHIVGHIVGHTHRRDVGHIVGRDFAPTATPMPRPRPPRGFADGERVA